MAILADTIRYLSLHDNKFLRYFPGHTKKLVHVKFRSQLTLFIVAKVFLPKAQVLSRNVIFIHNFKLIMENLCR